MSNPSRGRPRQSILLGTNTDISTNKRDLLARLDASGGGLAAAQNHSPLHGKPRRNRNTDSFASVGSSGPNNGGRMALASFDEGDPSDTPSPSPANPAPMSMLGNVPVSLARRVTKRIAHKRNSGHHEAAPGSRFMKTADRESQNFQPRGFRATKDASRGARGTRGTRGVTDMFSAAADAAAEMSGSVNGVTPAGTLSASAAATVRGMMPAVKAGLAAAEGGSTKNLRKVETAMERQLREAKERDAMQTEAVPIGTTSSVLQITSDPEALSEEREKEEEEEEEEDEEEDEEEEEEPEETEEEKAHHRLGSIQPTSEFMNYIRLASVFSVSFHIIMAPLRFAFCSDDSTSSSIWLLGPTMQVFYILLELWSIFDVVYVQFRLGYLDPQTKDTVLDRRLIKANYMESGRFFQDAFTAFPTDIINVAFFNSQNRYMTMLTMVKISRIPVFFKLVAQLQFGEMASSLIQKMPSIVRLFKILFLFFLILHVFGCVYWRFWLYVDTTYFLPPAEWSMEEVGEVCDMHMNYVGDGGPENGTWTNCVFERTLFRPRSEAIARTAGGVAAGNGKDSSIETAYFTAFYWSLLVVLGNSVDPVNKAEYMVTIVFSLLGMLVFAVIIGSASSLIASLDSEGEARLNQMNAVNYYMSFRGVPDWMQDRVRAYYEYLWVSGQAAHHKKAFDELPPMLQIQLTLCLKRQMIENCSVFKNLEASSIVAIMHRLEETIAIPGEVVILQGSVGDKMFFLFQGTVEVKLKKPDGTVLALAKMNRGTAFGEMGVIANDEKAVRSCSIVAVTFCELNLLNKVDLDQIRAECEDVDENLQMILEERMQADREREQAENNSMGKKTHTMQRALTEQDEEDAEEDMRETREGEGSRASSRNSNTGAGPLGALGEEDDEEEEGEEAPKEAKSPGPKGKLSPLAFKLKSGGSAIVAVGKVGKLKKGASAKGSRRVAPHGRGTEDGGMFDAAALGAGMAKSKNAASGMVSAVSSNKLGGPSRGSTTSTSTKEKKEEEGE